MQNSGEMLAETPTQVTLASFNDNCTHEAIWTTANSKHLNQRQMYFASPGELNRLESEEAGSVPAFVRSIVYLQESLTIFTWVTVKCPCSSLVFVAPLSFAAAFASSFMLCMGAFETTPVAITV